MAPNAKQFQEWLDKHGACRAARRWCSGKTFEQAWRLCPRFDWLEWLIVRLGKPLPHNEKYDKLWSARNWAPSGLPEGKRAELALCSYLRKHVKLPKEWR